MYRHVAWSPRVLAPLSGLLILAVAIGELPTSAGAQPVIESSVAFAIDNTDNSIRPDAVSAMVTARATGERVEDLSQRTETVRVFANPNGTWTSDGTTEPERVQGEDGTWEDLDTSLVQGDGGLSPVAAPSDVVFSDGGDKVFAALTDERGERLEWRWPSILPAPVVDGATVTYRDALKGVGDLVVTATTTGFTHHILIPQRPSGPVEVTIPVATGGAELVKNAGGEIAVETAAGDTLAASARPLMWDSSENSDGEPEIAPVDTSIGRTSTGTLALTLSPDDAFMADPETVYPVIVDPSFTINPSGDTWVENLTYTSSQSASADLKAGASAGGKYKARSFLRFDNGTAQWCQRRPKTDPPLPIES